MPEYLAPGVYVEETSFRAKSIEGVSTSTAGFVGPTRKGPITGTPELVTSIGDFERIYGGPSALDFSDLGPTTNYVAHAVRNFFENGGQRLYVARVFQGGAGSLPGVAVVVDNANAARRAAFRARFPGAAANGRIEARELATPATKRTLDAAPAGSVARFGPDGAGEPEEAAPTFHLKGADGAWSDAPEGFDDLAPDAAPAGGAEILTLTVTLEDADGSAKVFEDLGFDRSHRRWVGHVLAASPGRRTDDLENLYALDVGAEVTGTQLRAGLFPTGDVRSFRFSGGDDGAAPTAAAYAGIAQDENDEGGLSVLERLEDISIVAAPGSSAYGDAQAILNSLISHAERPRAYRIAVLDTPSGQALSGARTVRSRIDSTYGALYYPWVVVSNPEFRPGDESLPREIALPPSGFVCGIYARNDTQRGVHKAPANEVVRGAIRFETDISFAQQGVLNPNGINALRFFPGRGFRVWGARTASSDPEWKYVNVRRYFLYLEQSIDRGTQWAVFESNGPRLWTNVRETIESFLYNEWFTGALLGGDPQEAYFVRCDRSTMTQNDLDNGRLVCEIGVAVLKPAEFVIFRIGQKTSDAR